MPDQRILLVEDDPEIGVLLLNAFLRARYTADLACTAGDAFDRLASMRYDLVITDWLLPDGDGLAIAAKAANQGMKTIVMSGYLVETQNPDKRHQYILKPMLPEELIAAVLRLTREVTI